MSTRKPHNDRRERPSDSLFRLILSPFSTVNICSLVFFWSVSQPVSASPYFSVSGRSHVERALSHTISGAS